MAIDWGGPVALSGARFRAVHVWDLVDVASRSFFVSFLLFFFFSPPLPTKAKFTHPRVKGEKKKELCAGQVREVVPPLEEKIPAVAE